MKKIIISTFFIGLLFSCNKITDINVDPKSASKVPGETLFTGAQKGLTDLLADPSVNLNVWRLIDQYWTETQYVDESNYNLNYRGIPDNVWDRLYPEVLKDLDESGKILTADEATSAKYSQTDFKNVMGCVKITKVYAWYLLVTTYGDIPFTEALNANNLTPAYDDASTVYTSLLDSLNDALGSLDASGSGLGSADLVYGGDIGGWIKFGNSLKLMMGMLLSDVDNSKAQSIVEAAAPNTFTSSDDNPVFTYDVNYPNTNPIFNYWYISNRRDFVAANTFVNLLTSLNDPRMTEFFDPNNSGNYVGAPYATPSSFPQFASASARMLAPDFEQLWMSYSQVEFLKAEAAARGYNVGGTPASHYDNAITASMKYWGVSDADIATYLSSPDVNYATAQGDYKEKIGMQEYISLYNQPLAEWTVWRRLDWPQLKPGANATSAIPVRYTYPLIEEELNDVSWSAAAAKINGGDKVSSKLFWDKF